MVFEAQNLYMVMSVGAVVMLLAGYLVRGYFAGKKLREAESKAKDMIRSAEQQVDSLQKEAEIKSRDLMLKVRQDFEVETKERREEIAASEKRLTLKEENLDRRVDLMEKKENDLNARLSVFQSKEEDVVQKAQDLEKLIEEEKTRLQKMASMTRDEAKKVLLSRLDEELLQEKAHRVRQMEEEIKNSSEKKAQVILSSAIQKCASEHTAMTTVTVVSLPSDEMKGRIIGREGRNIRALEAAAGVDVIIDDTPEAVTISSFDMYRREVAKNALESLIADGRIHPARIEEVVEKAKKEMDGLIQEEGEKTAFDLGIHNMHPELLKLVGRLKFRTSYGQNGLMHTKEVALLCGAIASQLGMDVKLATRAGLLHDIGKIVPQEEEEGTHAVVGGRLSRRYGEKEEVANAVESHHEEVECNTLYGPIVQAADAISASRPGARAETLEKYVKRLEELEKIVVSFKGVEKVYALQAGREVRILVDPEKINDDESVLMARDIRKKVEEEMEYPGQIKIIVLREKRAVEYAK